MLKQALQRTVILYELRCSLLANARNSGDVVAGVTPHSKYVNQLSGSVYAVFLAHLFGTHNRGRIVELGRLVDENIVAHQLAEVLVGRHHIGEIARFFGFFGQSAYNIVGLIALSRINRYVETLDDIYDIWDGCFQIGRHSLAVGLVVAEVVGTQGRGSQVESYPYVRRLLILQYLIQRIQKPYHSRGVNTFRRHPRIFVQSKKRPVNQRVGIQQKYLFLILSNHSP